MDSNGILKQALRYDHLQRILKKYELEALNSLRGPATLGGNTADVSSIVGGPTLAEKPMLSSLLDATTVLGRQDKTLDRGSLSGLPASIGIQRSEQSEVGTSGARLLGVDRSTLQQQETLLKEIIAIRGAIPLQPSPVLTAQDRTSSGTERRETLLEGEIITCFDVGGEKRLCFPQVLNTVLKSVSMVDINRACTELNIHCGHCTPEQLLVLKIAGVVSATTASCALITKTDAERLCDYLLRQKVKDQRPFGKFPTPLLRADGRNGGCGHRSDSKYETLKRREDTKADSGINVIHFCFGRCRGRYYPSLYASPSAECIDCDECGQLFAPDRFVVHSHGNRERHICHWGFDSANWRAYLHLTDDDECESNLKILKAMKLRFDVTGLTKRHLQLDADQSGETGNVDGIGALHVNKRIRLDAPEQHCHVRHSTATAVKPPLHEPAALAVPKPTLVTPSDDPAALPYLLCDPVLLAAYYQAAFAAASATIRAAAGPQSTSSTTAMVSPSLLPPQMTSSLATSAKQQQWPIGSASLLCDGFGAKAGQMPIQFHPRESQLLLDEATAAAALKLLQLHSGDAGTYGLPPSPKQDVHPTLGQAGADIGKYGQGNVEHLSAATADTKKSSIHQTFSFRKESFKKQLLHLFAAEQQQKEDQKLQRMDCPKSTDLGRRMSIEVIVDDEKKLSTASRLDQSIPSSDTEKHDCVGDVSTPDTQLADEISVSSSDNEGASGDLSLDELLRRYITDAVGLKTVRAKIAENQRYLEQKLDAVSAENRILHAECLQLRMQQKRDLEGKREGGVASNILGKDVAGSLLRFLPKQFTL